MAFTGNENHDISLADAAQLTENYRTTSPPASTLGHYFGRAAIEAILAQGDCVGIRIYYAKKNDGTKQLVITGVSADENDMYNGVLAEKSYPCPPRCSSLNPLNS